MFFRFSSLGVILAVNGWVPANIQKFCILNPWQPEPDYLSSVIHRIEISGS